MEFYRNKDNSDYLMFNIKELKGFSNLKKFRYFASTEQTMIDYNEIEEISLKIDKLLSKLIIFYGDYIDFDKYRVAINQYSDLGMYLLKEENKEEIIDRDKKWISKQDIRNAFLISEYDENCKVANKIQFMFKAETAGSFEELLNEGYPNTILNYIIKNKDIDKHIALKKGSYSNEKVIVYEEDGKIINRPLLPSDDIDKQAGYQYLKK